MYSTAHLNQNDLASRYWDAAQGLAAAQRLVIAEHYRDQFEEIDTEFANLRASQSWLASQHDDGSARLLSRYVEVLAPYLIQRGLAAILVRWCDNSLRASKGLRSSAAAILVLRGEAYRALGRWEEAMNDVLSALSASSNSEPNIYARALVALGRLQLNQGSYREAFDTLTRAETLLDKQSDQEELATARMELAAYYLLQGQLDQAIARYIEVERSHQRTSSTEPTDQTLLMLGVLYRKKGKYAQAEAYLQRLLTRIEQRHDQAALATVAHHLAWVHLNEGRPAQARQLCGQSITLYEDIGDTRGLSDAQEQLGLINLAEGNTVTAIACLERSLEIRRRLGNQHGAASSLRRLAVAYWHAGYSLVGICYLWQSIVAYTRLGVLSPQRMRATLSELQDWIIGQRRRTT